MKMRGFRSLGAAFDHARRLASRLRRPVQVIVPSGAPRAVIHTAPTLPIVPAVTGPGWEDAWADIVRTRGMTNPSRRGPYPRALAAKYIAEEYRAGRRGKQAVAIGIARARRRRRR